MVISSGNRKSAILQFTRRRRTPNKCRGTKSYSKGARYSNIISLLFVLKSSKKMKLNENHRRRITPQHNIDKTIPCHTVLARILQLLKPNFRQFYQFIFYPFLFPCSSWQTISQLLVVAMGRKRGNSTNEAMKLVIKNSLLLWFLI